MDEEAKQLMARKLRFKLLTKAFYVNKDKPNKKPKFHAK